MSIHSLNRWNLTEAVCRHLKLISISKIYCNSSTFSLIFYMTNAEYIGDETMAFTLMLKSCCLVKEFDITSIDITDS